MKIEITAVNINYREGQLSGVQAYYNGYNTNRTVNVSGHLPLTIEEYQGNESLESLTALVKTNLIDALTSPENAIID